MPLDAGSLGLEGRLQDRRRGWGGGLCLQVGAAAGSPLCSPLAGLDSPFPWPSPLPSCPLPTAAPPTPPRWRFCLSNHRGPSLAGAPALNSAPRVTIISKPERTGGRELASGKGLLEEKAVPSPPPTPAHPLPGLWLPLPGGRLRTEQGARLGDKRRRGEGTRAEGAARARVCARARACWGAGWALSGARRLQPTSGSLSSPRGFA